MPRANLAKPVGNIRVSCPLGLSNSLLNRPEQCLRKGNQTVFPALAVSYHDLLVTEVDILHAQAQTFGHPQAGPVHQIHHKPKTAVHYNFLPSKHNRHSLLRLGTYNVVKPFQLNTQDSFLEKKQRTQCAFG